MNTNSNNQSQTEQLANANTNTELKFLSGLIGFVRRDSLSKYSFVCKINPKRIIQVYSFDKEAAQKSNPTFPFVQKLPIPTDIGKNGNKQRK